MAYKRFAKEISHFAILCQLCAMHLNLVSVKLGCLESRVSKQSGGAKQPFCRALASCYKGPFSSKNNGSVGANLS